MKLKTISQSVNVREAVSPRANSWLKNKIKNADKQIANYTHRKELYAQMESDLETIASIDPDVEIGFFEPIWPQLGVEITGASSSHYDEYKKFGKAWNDTGKDQFLIYYELPDSWGLTKDKKIDHKLDK